MVSERNRFTAVLFYGGGTLAVLGIFHNLIWWYGAYRARLTSPDLTTQKRRALTLTWMAGPVLYGGASDSPGGIRESRWQGLCCWGSCTCSRRLGFSWRLSARAPVAGMAPATPN